MYQISEAELSPDIKLQILHNLIKDISIGPLIEDLSTEELLALKQFIWEKTVEIGIRTKGKNFSSDEITGKFVSTEVYQKQQNCKEPMAFCNSTECFKVNPLCATNRVKGQIEKMANAIQGFIKIE